MIVKYDNPNNSSVCTFLLISEDLMQLTSELTVSTLVRRYIPIRTESCGPGIHQHASILIATYECDSSLPELSKGMCWLEPILGLGKLP